MAEQLTYLCAPSHRFSAETGSIRLGSIITDPTRPHRVKSTVGKETLRKEYPQLDTVKESQHDVRRGTSSSMSAAVWATFAQTVSAGMHGKRHKQGIKEYTMESLETRYFRDDPEEHIIKARLAEEPVETYMKPKLSLLRRPVYMINGIMIAKSLVIKAWDSQSSEGNVGAAGSGPTSAGDVGGGGEISASQDTHSKDESHLETDVVFAYQLLEIKYGTLNRNKIHIDEYRPKAGFLGLDDGKGEPAGGEDEALVFSKLEGSEIDGVEKVQVSLEEGRQLTIISFPERI